MSPLRDYRVIQEREVKISATSPANAAALSERIFSGTKTPEDQINIISPVREISLDVREDY